MYKNNCTTTPTYGPSDSIRDDSLAFPSIHKLIKFSTTKIWVIKFYSKIKTK